MFTCTIVIIIMHMIIVIIISSISFCANNREASLRDGWAAEDGLDVAVGAARDIYIYIMYV